jgi:hypothetical protein
MSIRIVCPSCSKVYNLDETVQGKTVLCRACRSPIVVPALARQGRPDERIAAPSRPMSMAERAGRDDDDEPRRRPAERRSRREDEAPQGGKNLLLILLGIGGVAFVLIGLGVFVYLRVSKSSKPVAVANKPLAPAAGKVDPPHAPVADLPAGPAQGAIPPGPAPAQQDKNNPLDPPPPPGPFAGNDPPAGPAPGPGLAGDLAALRGTWQSGPVPADDGRATGTVKLSISPRPNSLGGRVQMNIATKQAGRTTSSQSNYSFTLRQNGAERLLVTTAGRRGRGIVLVYHFEAGQLVVSGKVSSLRFGYTLKNVGLRRTSAAPEQPLAGNPANPAPPGPAAGGRGKDMAVALKFSGDVFSYVQAAVRDKRLADVDVRGFTLQKTTYRDVCEEGVLIGLQVGLGKAGNNTVVKSWRPLFLTKDGERPGKWQGPAPASPITLKAKPGYVVSGLWVRTGLGVDSLSLVFTKLGPNGYISGDMYNSESVGGTGGNRSSIGGNGALFVGVTGHLSGDGSPTSLGLVAVRPKD